MADNSKFNSVLAFLQQLVRVGGSVITGEEADDTETKKSEEDKNSAAVLNVSVVSPISNNQAALLAAILSMQTITVDSLTERHVTRQGVMVPVLEDRVLVYKKMLDKLDADDTPAPDIWK